MICIHLTESTNLNSIAKKGLLLNKPYLNSHRDRFKASLKTERVIYSTLLTSKKRTEKYLKDFIYFQIWGKPRNIWIGENRTKRNKVWDIHKVYDNYFELNFKRFSILSFQVNPEKEKYLKAFHIQNKTLWGLEDIDERFSHVDKELVVLPREIKSNRLSEIGRAYPVIRNNRIQNIKLEGWG